MTTTAPHLDDQTTARIAYDTIRAHQAACGDPVHPPWERADPDAVASYLAGVALVRTGATAEERHAQWVDWQLRVGRTGRPVEVPYDQLGEAGRRRGDLFAAVVGALS